MSKISFQGVSKSYDKRTFVLENFDLDIKQGEFITLLGPSGSGKTTCLMLLAGFEQPTTGTILRDDRELTGVPPHKRDIGFVFQSYALFPHMTVFENIAFPMRVRKASKQQIEDSVHRVMEIVRLTGYGDRSPSQLSGGQQQRVALARALVYEPEIVLMDEPLGALDRQLRDHMQQEIKRIHEQLGITIVYVTHDQTEALTMSDRIAVFNEGKIQQLDTPAQVYQYPNNSFVAAFMSESHKPDWLWELEYKKRGGTMT